jgi:ParB family transcriptional regulator, chromosome partitioning protein
MNDNTYSMASFLEQTAGKKTVPDKPGSRIRLMSEARWIPIEMIRENPCQPRKRFSEKSLNTLAESIRQRGVLQPIRVRLVDDGFQIVAGERRFRACKRAGVREIPAILCEQSDFDASLDSIIENLHRVDLNAMERADMLDSLRVNLGSPCWTEIGKKIGLGKRQILNLAGLRALPESIQQDIRDDLLTEKHGRALKLLLAKPELMEKLHRKILNEKLSGDETLELARAMKCNDKGIRDIRQIRKTALKMMNLLSVMDFATCNMRDLTEIRNIVYSLVEKTESSIRTQGPLHY